MTLVLQVLAATLLLGALVALLMFVGAVREELRRRRE